MLITMPTPHKTNTPVGNPVTKDMPLNKYLHDLTQLANLQLNYAVQTLQLLSLTFRSTN
jgi:hypothetical protein